MEYAINTQNKLRLHLKDASQTQTINGSELLLEVLLNLGITNIFGYPGGAILPIYDALYDYKSMIHHVLSRHEQGALHAAQGYARASGNVGVAIVTSGPGATNAITGLMDALMDSTPILCISGQVYSHLIGTDAFQEADIIHSTTAATKWNVQISNAVDIPYLISKAFCLAKSGRPGPVLVDITKDALMQSIALNELDNTLYNMDYTNNHAVSLEKLKEAVSLIENAKQPLLLVGQGVILGDACQELSAFIAKTQIPFACTLLGLGTLPYTHPLYVGMLGMHGNYAPNLLTNQADLIIAIGMRFDDRVTSRLDQYAPQAKIIHIDIDAAEINKNKITTVALQGNCKNILPELRDLCSALDHSLWLQKFKEAYQKEDVAIIQPIKNRKKESLLMAQVINSLNQFKQKDAIILSDVGQHQMICSRFIELNFPRTYITSGGLGTMGFCLPAAIGAQVAYPEKEVIAVVGDGGFQMTIQELGTIMELNLPIKIILLNNEHLGMVRQWQELFHKERYSSVAMQNPLFSDIAKGYKIGYEYVDNLSALDKAVYNCLNSRNAFLLEVKVENQENVFPMIPQGKSVSDILLSKPQ